MKNTLTNIDIKLIHYWKYDFFI